MKKTLLCILTAALTLSMVACAQPAAGQVIQSEKPRVTSPDVIETDLATLVEGNSTFAFTLYHALKETDDNLFYSPYSVSLALAMTYAGARTETAQQMADTLHFTLPQDSLHPAFNSLDIALNRRGEGAAGKDGEGFRLNVVNAIWGQENYEFRSEFLDLLAENYGAGLRILDFANAPEVSRVTINDWVSDQTERRIEDLIPPGAINILTRLVLTNAIYFNSAWQYPFPENMTADGVFYLLDGNEITVPMMKQTESLGYAENAGYQAVDLPYDGGELSMVILLPQIGQLGDFENAMDAQQVQAIIESLEHKRVALAMPGFEFASIFSLKEALAAMGMPVAFSESADFSGIAGNRELFITDVVHKAFVSVDEAGTEAAAATAVIVGTTGIPESPVEVTLNHPFIFLIRDIETGAILFVGRVVNPSA